MSQAKRGLKKERGTADIVHEAQDAHLCALFIGAHGDTGDYEYALDAANSAAKHLQVIQAGLPATSPLARDASILAKFVRAAQRNLSQQRPANNPDELLGLATRLKESLEGANMQQPPPPCMPYMLVEAGVAC